MIAQTTNDERLDLAIAAAQEALQRAHDAERALRALLEAAAALSEDIRASCGKEFYGDWKNDKPGNMFLNSGVIDINDAISQARETLARWEQAK